MAKKYPSIVLDLRKLEAKLIENPKMGVDLGGGLQKIRMNITSKNRGKSGGARVITYTTIIAVQEQQIVLLTIYDKSEYSSISDKELKKLVAEL